MKHAAALLFLTLGLGIASAQSGPASPAAPKLKTKAAGPSELDKIRSHYPEYLTD